MSPRKPFMTVRNSRFPSSFHRFQRSSMHQTSSIDSGSLVALGAARLSPVLQTLAQSCSAR